MAKSKLDIFTKKMIKTMSLKKIQKRITCLMKPKNLYKVLILFAVLLILYFIHQKYLVKEGMTCTAENFETDIDGKKALVLFHADWCGHCKRFMPEWDKISSEVASMDGVDVMLAKVECGNAKDNDAHKDIMEKYNIKGYPTILSFDKSGNHTEYDGERTKSGVFKFLGINENSASVSEGFSEGMSSCEEYFKIKLKTAAKKGDHVLIFDAADASNFSAKGGERPVLEGSIAKGAVIDSVATSADEIGWKVTLDTSLVQMDDYQGNKYHVITNNNTNDVSGNELCKGFIQADWENEPAAGDDYFYVNEKDASNISSGMYLAEGYGVVMPPHVYKTYTEGTDLRVVLCNGIDCDSIVNEVDGATPDPQVITSDIDAGTEIMFIKQPSDSAWVNEFSS